MAQDAGTISADVRVALDRLRGDVKAVSAQFDKIADSSETVSKESESNFSKGFEATQLAGVAAFTAINAAAVSAIKTYADYEQSVANVAAVSGATGDELLRLQEAAQEAGETTRFTASQAADALFFLASAGLNAADSAEALSGVLELAGATGSDLAFTSQTVTATLAQFNIAAADSARVSNVFAAANANSQATTEKLAAALRQVGPIANGLNISLEETTGALQLLFNAGFRGEAAGVALRNALADLADGTSPAIKELAALGVAFEDVNPTAVGIEGAIRALEEAGLDTADTIRVFGKEAGPQLSTLISQGASAIREYTDAVTDTNAAAEQYAIQNDTTAGAIDRLKSQSEALAISYTQSVAPAINLVINLVRNFLAAVNAIPGPLKAVVGGAIGLTAALGGLNAALALVGASLLGPAGIVVGVGAATVALVGFIGRAKEVRSLELQEEFAGVAKELGVAAENSAEFAEKASLIAGALGRNFDSSFESVSEQVQAIAENLNLSQSEIVKIGLASKDVGDRFKEQLAVLEEQLDREDQLRERGIERDRIYRNLNEKRKEAVEQAQEELAAEERLRAIEEERRQEVINGRQAITDAYNEELEAIQTKEELGILATEEAVEARLDLEREFQNDLIALGYDGVAGQKGYLEEGDKQIQGSIDRQLELYRQLAELQIESQEGVSGAVGREINNVSELSAAAIEDRENRIKAAADQEIAEAERVAAQRRRLFTEYVSIATSAFGSISSIVQSQAEQEIEAINARLEAQLEAFDVQLEAALEAAGVSEETTQERLQRELEEARSAGDAELAAELEKEIERERIISEFEERRRKAKEDAAKEAAKLEYEAALTSWRLDKATAIAQAAVAILRTAASVPFPLNVPLTAAQAAANGLQIAAISQARPTPPRLQTGGIVLPQNGGVPTVQAENGFPELSLNAGPSGASFLDMFASRIADAIGGGGGGSVTVPVYLDGKKIAESTVNNYVNSGSVTIAQRGIR